MKFIHPAKSDTVRSIQANGFRPDQNISVVLKFNATVESRAISAIVYTQMNEKTVLDELMTASDELIFAYSHLIIAFD